jgi:hypothetical protein
MKSRGIQLTERDLLLARAVGRFKFLTVQQIGKTFFPGTSRFAPTNRLGELAKGEILSRVFSYPKVERGRLGRPTAVYYFGSKNQNRLKDWLERNQMASHWEDFKDLALTNNQDFSQLYLAHETAISEFFLILETAIKNQQPIADLIGEHKPIELVFWERLSPISKEIGETLYFESKDGMSTKCFFNPDAFFALRHDRGFDFFFLEFDNNTASLPKYRKKLEGYLAYNTQRKFSKVLELYARRYALPITNFERAPFRVLTIAPDARRRDILLLEAVKLKSYKMLWFAALDELTPETILTESWLRGKEFDEIEEQRRRLAPELAPYLKMQWLTEKINEMPRVALL